MKTHSKWKLKKSFASATNIFQILHHGLKDEIQRPTLEGIWSEIRRSLLKKLSVADDII